MVDIKLRNRCHFNVTDNEWKRIKIQQIMNDSNNAPLFIRKLALIGLEHFENENKIE